MSEQGINNIDFGASTFVLTPGCIEAAYCLYKGDTLAWGDPELAADRDSFAYAIRNSIAANKDRMRKPISSPCELAQSVKEDTPAVSPASQSGSSQFDDLFSALNSLRPVKLVAGKTATELDHIHQQIDDAIERLRATSMPVIHDELVFKEFAESVGMEASHYSVPHASFHSQITRFARLSWLTRSFLGDVGDERFFFENLARAKFTGIDRFSDSNGAYHYAMTRCGWLSWQASAANKTQALN